MSRLSSDQSRRPVSVPAFLALGCVGFIASAPAYAAAPDAEGAAEQARATIVVTGVQEQASAKDVAPLIDTPRSIAVIDRQVIKETGSATLVEALRTVPGITFGAAEGGNPIGDRPFIRGFDSQGSTFIDGVRDSSAQSREVFAVDQIQIVRGSDSTLGGRGGAGGSINIVSKLPRRGNFAEVELSYGSSDYKRITGDVNLTLSDMVAVRVAGAWHDQGVAGRDALFQRRWGIAPSIKIGGTGPTSLTLAYYHLTSHELPDSGFPYLYTVANAPLGESLSEPAIGRVTTIAGVTTNVPRTTFYGLKNRDFRDSTADQITLRAEHDFGGIKLRNTSRFSRNVQDYIFTQPDDQQGNVFGTNASSPATAGGLVWRRSNTRYGYVETMTNQTDLFGTFTTGSIKHNFSAGGEFSFEKARRGTFVTRGFLNAAGNEILSNGSTISPRCTPAAIARFYCTSLFAPNSNDVWVNYASDTSTVAAPIVRNLPIAETQNDANTQSLYAFDSITITDKLIINLGARFDSFATTITPGQPIAATSTFSLSRRDNIFNYQAGVVFKPSANTSIYASYATSATPPNSLIGEGQETNALGTTNTQAAIDLLNSLKVETTKSYEIGAKADLFGQKLSLTLAAFQTETANARVTGSNGGVEFIGQRRAKGVEFGFNGQILPGWKVFGGYTYLDAVIVDGGFTSFAVAAVTGVGGVIITPARTIVQASVNTGRQFPQTAKHSASIWTDVAVTKKLSIGGGAFYTSRVFGGYSDNRAVTGVGAAAVVNPATRIIARSIPAYWRFDARLGYQFSDRLELSVNVQNLTDKVYFNQAYQAHYASIAPGRSAFATLRVKY